MQHTSIPFTLAFGPQGCMAEVKGRVVAVWRHDEWPRLFCGRADGGLTFLSLSLIMPDRKEKTLTAWLLTHPEIEVISRDRAGEYAAAAKKGAPQAQQIADKFHLLKNLRDGLKELMARKQKVLPEVEEASCDGIPLRAQGKRPASALEASPKPDEPEKQWRSMSKEPRHIAASSEHSSVAPSGSQVSRANRAARYEAVRALHQQAISAREIARRLHMSRQTVQKFLVAESFPERSTPPYRGRILDPYKIG